MSVERGTFPEPDKEGTDRPFVRPFGEPDDAEPAERGPGGAAGEGTREVPGEAADLRERILDALRNVLDPELGINIVDLGLVYDVSIEDDKVHITYTLTTMGCPIGPLIEAQMKQLLDQVGGISEFQAEMVFTPPWTPDKMSEEAKEALGVF